MITSRSKKKQDRFANPITITETMGNFCLNMRNATIDKEVYVIFCLTAVAGNQAESVYCKTYNISGLSLVLLEQGFISHLIC